MRSTTVLSRSIRLLTAGALCVLAATASNAKLAIRREVPSSPPSNAALRDLASDAMTEMVARLAGLDRPKGLSAADTVRVVLVRSRLTSSSWIHDLNKRWSDFGELPISVSTELNWLETFTYDDLSKAKADVVWLASPAGAKLELSASEIADLEKFQRRGGTVLGTGLVFGGAGSYDNRAAGVLFGIDTAKRVFMPVSGIVPKFRVLASAPASLADGLPQGDEFAIGAKPWVEVERGRLWDDDQIDGADIVGVGDYSGELVQTLTDRIGAGRGIYFSAPHEIRESQGADPNEANDGQLLYNAITFGFTAVGRVSGDVRVDGEPFADKRVYLGEGEIGCDLYELTDGTGVFEFAEVPVGTHTLEIPNIVNNVPDEGAPQSAGVMVADGGIEVNGVAAEGVPVYAVRIDVVPFDFLGPVITDVNGEWSIDIPNEGRWVIWAPGIGVRVL